ncbi:hypothetical protein Taro_038659 [Colocasia esculenta]|uniref:Uncharacterized protein n=1 Tax=Colocasia esculenta TaxID=4460 RepID=A0A843WGH2_COLES|nr:hypothetical protein [Colocasia esculenta]
MPFEEGWQRRKPSRRSVAKRRLGLLFGCAAKRSVEILASDEQRIMQLLYVCDDFLALGRSCSAKCKCNRDEVMQKLVEANEILRKRVQELQLQLEKKTRIAASLG